MQEAPSIPPDDRDRQTQAQGLVSFMAFDYGTKRTGVAAGNRITQTAQALPTIKAQGELRWPLIDHLIREWTPQAIVVGVPFHPDGAAHDNTHKARQFGRQLKARYRLPLFEVDERYSTVEAISGGAKDADGAAACIILEQFLRSIDL
jgi:putative holliday junction resolvase